MPDREIPVRDVRLNEPEPGRDPAPYVLPLSGAILVMGVFMMLCSPLTAWQLRSIEPPPEIAALPVDERPPPPPARPLDVVAVFTFFCLGTLGMIGGLLGLARLEWGRRVMLLFAPLLLIYMALMIGYKLTGGLGPPVSETAPTRSALGLFYVCTSTMLLAIVALLVATLRYLTRRDVKRTFRRVRFG